MEFGGVVEGLKVGQKGLVLLAGLYNCRSPRAGSAGGLQPGQSQSRGRSSLVGLKELCPTAPHSAFLVVDR